MARTAQARTEAMNRLRLRRELQDGLLADYEMAKCDLAAREADLADLRERATVLLATLAHLLAGDDSTAEIIGTGIKSVAKARCDTPLERVEAVLAVHRLGGA